MTSAFDFLFSTFDRFISFLGSCSFSVYGFNANLLGIFTGAIIFGIALSAFYHGGSY